MTIKRIAVVVVIAGLMILLLEVAYTEAAKRTFDKLYTITSEAVTYQGGVTRRTESEKKAREELAKEEKLDRIRDRYIAKHERELEAERRRKEEERKRIEANRQPNYPSGGHLTPSNGVYYFGNQRETYYNLDMTWVVSYARYNGIGGEYWIRSDGCKMLGDYIILACNRDVHPYGSIVLTSLGYGISLDTGGFAYDYPYGVDIAVNW